MSDEPVRKPPYRVRLFLIDDYVEFDTATAWATTSEFFVVETMEDVHMYPLRRIERVIVPNQWTEVAA